MTFVTKQFLFCAQSVLRLRLHWVSWASLLDFFLIKFGSYVWKLRSWYTYTYTHKSIKKPEPSQSLVEKRDTLGILQGAKFEDYSFNIPVMNGRITKMASETETGRKQLLLSKMVFTWEQASPPCRLALFVEISPSCEFPCKSCLRLHERPSPPKK